MSKNKQLSLISFVVVFVVGVVAPVFLATTPVSALPVTETITPTAWQPGSGGYLAIAQAGTPAPSITIASRNTPGTVINPGLDSTEEPDGSTSELSIITIPSALTTCSSNTPVDVTFSSYTRALQNAVPGNDGYTIASGLMDLSGPTLTGINIEGRDTDGSYSASGTGQTISTTAGNLSNIASFVNFEAVTFFGAHFQGTATLGLPTITLTYDNSTCPLSPTVTHNSVSKTIESSNTASGSVIVTGSSFGATDPNGDTLTYSISGGNTDGYFAINATNGDITTTRGNVPVGVYTLTILIADGNGGTTTVTATITVAGSALADTGDNTYALLTLAVGLMAAGLVGVFALRRKLT